MSEKQPEILAGLHRGDLLESYHFGHAVVANAKGEILFEMGNPNAIIYPRSSCKMLQALPLVESGAAKDAALTSKELALSCASHNGELMHTNKVDAWLKSIDLDETALRCGPQEPSRYPDQIRLYEEGMVKGRIHNNCSGKHAGFLTLNQKLGGDGDYHHIDHPVQIAVKQAFEEMVEETSPCYGIDGCSAPNHACSVHGLARGAAKMATPSTLGKARGEAAEALVNAMMAHPLLVAGTNRACSELMAAANGKAAIKTGAEGVFVAILPQSGLGIALKITDGATRASEAAIAALLVRLGVLDKEHPDVKKRLARPETNFNNEIVGDIRVADTLWQNGRAL